MKRLPLLTAVGLLAFLMNLATVGAVRAAAGPQGEQNAEPRYFYYYNNEKGEKEKIPLTLDTSRLLFVPSGAMPIDGTTKERAVAWEDCKKNPPKSLAKFGLGAKAAKADDRLFMWTIDVSDQHLSSDQFEALAAAIAADEQTEFVGPVFRGKRGSEFYSNDFLVVCFTRPLEAPRRLEVMDQLHLGRIVSTNHQEGLDDYHRVYVGAKNGFEVMRAQHRAAFHPDIRFADLDWIMTATPPASLPDDANGVANTAAALRSAHAIKRAGLNADSVVNSGDLGLRLGVWRRMASPSAPW